MHLLCECLTDISPCVCLIVVLVCYGIVCLSRNTLPRMCRPVDGIFTATPLVAGVVLLSPPRPLLFLPACFLSSSSLSSFFPPNPRQMTGAYARAFFGRHGKIDPLVHTMLFVGGLGYYLNFDHVLGKFLHSHESTCHLITPLTHPADYKTNLPSWSRYNNSNDSKKAHH